MTEHSIASWARQMYIVDRSDQLASNDPYLAFAMDEWLCRQAAQSGISICHIWRHRNAFILGQQDARLPYAKQAVEWLHSLGWLPIVRNSGGAAVPLDAGVVNLSLIFPLQQNEPASFHSDFEKMVELIAAALAHTGATVQKGEIAGAYCPGDYDLSIDGLKFCGIAQRRQLHAYAVQAFVIASGKGAQRTRLVREFYERAAGGADQSSHPNVTDQSTASLEELTGPSAQATHSFAEAIKQTIQSNQSTELLSSQQAMNLSSLSLPENEQLAAIADQLRQRYYKLQS